ncbi:MAG: DUF805 domain-containing protein [Oscillospiraceae bacterium]|nr:DUF805 domain-containing protein [Oscillospiraceae bacterium]
MKISFLKYIEQMWKRIFDYKGKSDRKEYWIPFAFNAVLTVIMLLCLLLKELLMLFFMAFPAIVIAAYLCLSFIPFISLTVRRLHDAGKSGKWYLLSFILGIGSVIVILMCAGKADMFDPYSNFPVGVYGPPDFEEDYDPSDNMNADVYGPPPLDDFDPSMNTQVAVYGPPEYFKIVTETSESVSEVTEVTYPEDFEPYIPEENVPAAVYGPPDYFGIETEATETEVPAETTAASQETDTSLQETTVVTLETVTDISLETTTVASEETAPPETAEKIDLPVPDDAFEPFFPEENAPICVYGPPEFFE